jgi:hypothetical protein
MNRIFKALLIFLVFLAIAACEKDDLCTPDQAASSRMVVVFKDISNPDVIKTAVNLRVKEIGKTNFAPLDFTGNTVITAADTIYLPLRNMEDVTSYDFYTDVDNITNIDNIDFRYMRKEVYVNRACGFKVDYDNLTFTRTSENPTDFWIQRIEIVDNSINALNEVHVEIFH